MSTGAADRVLALDVGGTNIRAALVDRAGVVGSVARRPIEKASPAALLAVLEACARETAAGAPPARAVGVAMKGFVDHRRGVMVASANLGLRDVPVKRWLEDRFGLRVEVDNDVHAATLAELGLGAGRTFRDFVYVNVGTGIAAGLVIDGRLCRGVANLAGEFGHVTVDRDGIPCHCGQKGCLEELAAGPRIVERYRKLRGGAPPVGTASGVFDLAAAGDAAAGAVLEAVTEDIGTGIVNLANLLNPEAVVLGGGVFRGSGVLAARIAAFVRARALREIAACLRSVDVSALEPGSVGILGAASLGWEIVKESQ